MYATVVTLGMLLQVGKKMATYWDPAKKLLNDPSKFLDSLLNFEKDAIKDSTIQKIEPYIGMEEFTPDAVARVSIHGCGWTQILWYVTMQTFLSLDKTLSRIWP